MVTLFSYKTGNSFLHKIPSWVKLLFIPLINVLFLILPSYFACGLVVVQFILACCLHFSLKEQFTDVKPVFYYAVLLYGFKLFLLIAGLFQGNGVTEGTDLYSIFAPLLDLDTFFLLIKLFCVMQSASLVFKTSTLLQLREGIEIIEGSIRKFFHLRRKNTFTNAISMFLNFIPMLAQIWEQSKKAWQARGGKKGVKMYGVLLPVLFSVGMKKAYNQARAILVRDKDTF